MVIDSLGLKLVTCDVWLRVELMRLNLEEWNSMKEVAVDHYRITCVLKYP